MSTDRKRPAREEHTGRITVIEVISYTALIGLVGALAAGIFDAMVPWR